MKRLFMGTISLFLLCLFCFSVPAAAQSESKGISKRDKDAIKRILKGVDPSKYYVRFNGGEETYGRKKVSMNDLKRVSKYSNPRTAAGWIIVIVEGADVVWIVAVGKEELKRTLGERRAQQLQSIAAKYD